MSVCLSHNLNQRLQRDSMQDVCLHIRHATLTIITHSKPRLVTHHQAQKTKLCAPLSNIANLAAACSTVRCNVFVTAKLFLSNTTVETAADVSNPIAVTFVHYVGCIFYTSIVKILMLTSYCSTSSSCSTLPTGFASLLVFLEFAATALTCC